MSREYIDTPCLYGPPLARFYWNFETMPLCSHLKAKLAKGGEYYKLVQRLSKDYRYDFKAIRRQLHIYKEGKNFSNFVDTFLKTLTSSDFC